MKTAVDHFGQIEVPFHLKHKIWPRQLVIIQEE